jgi:hypothetical protein
MNVVAFLVKNIHHCAELIALIISIRYYNSLSTSFMKWFPLFFAIIFFGELLAKDRALASHIHYTIAICESVFYGYIFHNLIEGQKVRKMIVVLISFSIVCYLVSYFFLDIDKSFVTFFLKALTVFGFIISAIALGYLYQQFDKREVVLNDPGFWIAFGVVIFYAGISIVFSLYPLLVEQKFLFFGKRLYNIVPGVLSVILYGSLTLSIVLYKKKIVAERTLNGLKVSRFPKGR